MQPKRIRKSPTSNAKGVLRCAMDFSSFKSRLNGTQMQTEIEQNGMVFGYLFFPSKWIGNEIFGREFYSERQ